MGPAPKRCPTLSNLPTCHLFGCVQVSGTDGRAGGALEVALVEGGESIAVTDQNKQEWLTRWLENKLVRAAKEKTCRWMRQGCIISLLLVRTDRRRRRRATSPSVLGAMG